MGTHEDQNREENHEDGVEPHLLLYRFDAGNNRKHRNPRCCVILFVLNGQRPEMWWSPEEDKEEEEPGG